VTHGSSTLFGKELHVASVLLTFGTLVACANSDETGGAPYTNKGGAGGVAGKQDGGAAGSSGASGSSGTSSGGSSGAVGSNGAAGSADSGGGGGSSGTAGSPDSGGGGSSSGAAGSAGSGGGGGTSGAAGSDGGPGGASDGGPSECVKGQVRPNQVVMLGDSYMDLGFLGPTIQKVAGATYRTYYLAGAALNYGFGQGNIPYQFTDMAVTANPDIKVVIMTGGGNDILLNNRQCLVVPVQGDTQCHKVVDDALGKARELLSVMATKGVKQIVYLFYPHIDANTIFTGPNSNDWLDHAYPKAAQLCCGAATAPEGAADLTCHGSPTPGVECTFIDTRPEYVGHNDPKNPSMYWLDGFGIHPTQPGADLIAGKVWAQMQKYCVAQ
jgi:hypothetical protein